MAVFMRGMRVQARGQRFVVLDFEPLNGDDGAPLVKLRLQGLEGPWRNEILPLLHPIDTVVPDQPPDVRLDAPGRFARFRLLHDAFLVDLAPEPSLLVGHSRSRLTFEPYQQVPALRALSLPRPRLLVADDVGLGKTIEAGLIVRELSARRRANRVLIVSPVGIMEQWQQEMAGKFGFEFVIFDRETIYERRRALEAGANPWQLTPRVITSMDFAKRREGAFRELYSSRWDVIIVDEAHHLAGGRNEEDHSDRYRLGQWLAEATDDCLLLLTATPHDGYDETFRSLLEFLEPSIVPPGQPLRFDRYRRHLVRRLKRHVVAPDGTPKFRERPPAEGIAVALQGPEIGLHEAVQREFRRLTELAGHVRQVEAEPIRLVATTLRKRAASSRAALQATINTRRENVQGAVTEADVRRDHLRALRHGETIPDEALKDLERDLHLGYLAAIRRASGRIRRLQEEERALAEIEQRLADCADRSESKMLALAAHLRRLRTEDPRTKVIVFSEYADTVQTVAAHLRANGYGDSVEVITGHLSQSERRAALGRFASQAGRVLVATDAAGEGLNLQEHCHHLVHFDLPWNPNRLAQRNGRIDRYGQPHVPRIAFLYAQDTYDGEVLARLIRKIEQQIIRLGAVGDVLGALQAASIEQWLLQAPDDERAAVEAISRQQDDMLTTLAAPAALQDPDRERTEQSEIEQASEAASRGAGAGVQLDAFVESAVRAAQGGVERRGDALVVATPGAWVADGAREEYRVAVGSTTAPGDVLSEDHALVRVAVRWVRLGRFSTGDDHRLAYTIAAQLTAPDLLATFIVTLRDGRGHEIQRLEAVRVDPDLTPSHESEADLATLRAPGGGNLSPERLAALFGGWWERARQAAGDEAWRRARAWRTLVEFERAIDGRTLREELDRWDAATMTVILGDRPAAQVQLLPEAVPLTTRRRVREHQRRRNERIKLLEQYLRIEQPAVEPLGVLLRVPAALIER